jgi:hypothetical protein
MRERVLSQQLQISCANIIFFNLYALNYDVKSQLQRFIHYKKLNFDQIIPYFLSVHYEESHKPSLERNGGQKNVEVLSTTSMKHLVVTIISVSLNMFFFSSLLLYIHIMLHINVQIQENSILLLYNYKANDQRIKRDGQQEFNS